MARGRVIRNQSILPPFFPSFLCSSPSYHFTRLHDNLLDEGSVIQGVVKAIPALIVLYDRYVSNGNSLYCTDPVLWEFREGKGSWKPSWRRQTPWSYGGLRGDQLWAKAWRLENEGCGKACKPIQLKQSVHNGACEAGRQVGIVIAIKSNLRKNCVWRTTTHSVFFFFLLSQCIFNKRISYSFHFITTSVLWIWEWSGIEGMEVSFTKHCSTAGGRTRWACSKTYGIGVVATVRVWLMWVWIFIIFSAQWTNIWLYSF